MSATASLRGRELGAIGALNIVQGLPSYFFTIALPAILRDAGASLNVVALTYIIWLPWALKWLWAPVFDTRPRLRTVALKVTPFGMAAIFAVLGLFSPDGSQAVFLGLALISAVLGATLQVVLAAEIIHRCDERGRSFANTVQVAAITLGGILGSSVLLYLGDVMGWRASVWLTACLMLCLGISAFAVSGSDVIIQSRGSIWTAVKSRSAFLLLVCSGMAAAGDGFLGPWLIDRGFGVADVGRYLGLLALLSMLPIVSLSGFLLRRLGQRRALAVLFAVKGGLLAVLWFADMTDGWAVCVAILSFAWNAGVMTAMWQVYMAAVRKEHASTGCGFLTSAEAMVVMLGGIALGQLAGSFGYSVPFGIGCTAALAGCALALRFAPRRPSHAFQ